MKSVRSVSLFAVGLAVVVLLVTGVVRAAPGDLVRSKNCLVTAIDSGLPVPLNSNASFPCSNATEGYDPVSVLVTFACDGGALDVRLTQSSLERGLFAAQLQASLNQGKRFKEISTSSEPWVLTSDCSKCDVPVACTASLNYWGLTTGSTVTRNRLEAWKM